MEQAACLLRDTILSAIEKNIPRRKSSTRAKVWWTEEVTSLGKTMAHNKHIWKANRTPTLWKQFTTSRTQYFYAIRKAKQTSWTEFLQGAAGKEVFQAYKFTKPRRIEKLPSISQPEGGLVMDFNSKCKAFITAMFLPPPITTAIDISQIPGLWPQVIQKEIQQAIFTSSGKKAPGPDGISFTIIQEAYKAIPDLFYTVYSVLIENGYHPHC